MRALKIIKMEQSPKQKRSYLKSIFLSPDEPRLRAGWRLLLQTIFMVLILLGFSVPLGVLVLIRPELLTSPLLNALIAFSMFTFSVLIARRWLDRRSIGSLGLQVNHQALKDLLMGILITLPMMGLIYLALWGAGWLTFQDVAWKIDPLNIVVKETFVVLLTFLVVGWSEELLCRGYQLQTIEGGLNTFWAVLISSIIFSLMHLDNPNAESVWFVFLGLLFAGIFLAYGYLRTRQLWLPIGLHIGWNFFEGAVFGFPVSGLNTYRLILVTVDGPELWTGGSFGPEAGFVLVPALVLGFTLISIYTRGRLTANANYPDGIESSDGLISSK